MAITVTMKQTRQGDAGATLTTGQTYSLRDALARELVGLGYATDVYDVIRDTSDSIADSALVIAATQLGPLNTAGTPVPVGTLLRDPTTGLIYGQSDGNGGHLPFKSARLHGDIRAQITADSSKMSIHAVSGVVSTAPGHLFGGWFVNPGTNGSVKFYDNASAASGRVLYESTSAEVVRAGWTYISADGVDTDNGIYIELSGTANPTVLVWFEGEYPEAVDWTGVTERWFDGTNGNNSNDGLTELTPKKDIFNSGVLFSSGNHRIHLKYGTRVHLGISAGNSTSFASSAKVQIDAYGDSSLGKPVLWMDSTDSANNWGFTNTSTSAYVEMSNVDVEYVGALSASGSVTFTAPLVNAVSATLTGAFSGTSTALAKFTLDNGSTQYGSLRNGSTEVLFVAPVTAGVSATWATYATRVGAGVYCWHGARGSFTNVSVRGFNSGFAIAGDYARLIGCDAEYVGGALILGQGDFGSAMIDASSTGAMTAMTTAGTAGTLGTNWTGATGNYLIYFYSAVGQRLTSRMGAFTNGSTAVTLSASVAGAINYVKVLSSASTEGLEITFNPAPTTTSATLASAWAGQSGRRLVQLFVGGVGGNANCVNAQFTNGQVGVTFDVAPPASAQTQAFIIGPSTIVSARYALVKGCNFTKNSGDAVSAHNGNVNTDNVIIDSDLEAGINVGGSYANAVDFQAYFAHTFVGYNALNARNSFWGGWYDDREDNWPIAADPYINVGRAMCVGNTITGYAGQTTLPMTSKVQYPLIVGNYVKVTQGGGTPANGASGLHIGDGSHSGTILFNTWDITNPNRVVINAGYGLPEVGIPQQNFTFKGNLVIQRGAAAVGSIMVRSTDIASWDIDNNCYWYPDSAGQDVFLEQPGATGNSAASAYTIANWRLRAGTPDVNSLNVNPGLTADGKLPAGSALIGAGPVNAACYLLPYGPVWHKGSASIGMHDPQS